MKAGDVVRYRQEFLSPHSGINCPFVDIADCCGEVIELRAHDVVMVRWDDDTESSARSSVLEVVSPPLCSPKSHYQEDLLAWRTLVLADIQRQFQQQWASNKFEILKKINAR